MYCVQYLQVHLSDLQILITFFKGTRKLISFILFAVSSEISSLCSYSEPVPHQNALYRFLVESRPNPSAMI